MRRGLRHWLVLGGLVSVTAYAVAEEVTLTTYYPSPRGVYEELRTTGPVYFEGGSGDLVTPTTPTPTINALDIAYLNSIILGTVSPTINELATADIDGDGRVTPDDLGMLQFMFGGGVSRAVAKRQVHALYGTRSDGANLYFTVGGNVGIGTEDPTGRLHVVGPRDAASVVAFMPGTDDPTTPSLPELNVGIGTLNPTARLDIESGPDLIGDSAEIPLRLRPKTQEFNLVDLATLITVGGEGTIAVAPRFGSSGPPYQLYFHDGSNLTVLNAWLTGASAPNSTSFTGDVTIHGPLTADSINGVLSSSGLPKPFVIPHPLDPIHQTLIHASIEGPEAAVYYRGEGQLKEGVAVVELPHYFEALTRLEGRTVTLTPQFAAMDEPLSTLAASSVTDGQFVVRSIDGRNPAQRFFWEVKAVRADAPPLLVEIDDSVEHVRNRLPSILRLGQDLQAAANGGGKTHP